MRIEDSQATFGINSVGGFTGDTYMGNFRVKCLLSPLEQIKADRTYREILGVNSHLASTHVREVAYALSQLEQRIIEAPPFWENDEIPGGHVEENVILEVLDYAIEAQEKYMQGKKKELQEKQETLTAMVDQGAIEREPEVEEVGSDLDEEIDV